MTDLAATPRLFALVPCAGSGRRAGTDAPKQYRTLAGRALVAHTLAALAAVPRLAATLVVLARDDERFEAAVPGFAGARGWVARVGGATRAASVAAGLDELSRRGAGDDDWVLVHDAARPGLAPRLLERLRDRLGESAVGGLLALPVSDTVKRAAGDGRSVAATVERERLWLAQTPQMFRLGLLLDALSAHAGVTDEAAAVERAGHAPLLVEGARANFKVTTAEDLELMRALLERR